MRKVLIFPAVLFFISFAYLNGQDNQSGSVVYEEVAKLEFKLEGEMAHLMKDMPKERRVKKILYFSPQASLYTSMPKDSEDTGQHMGSGFRVMINEPENILYLDLVKKEMIEQRDFMTRMFLINGEMPGSDWKISGEQKMILDYPCMEATKTDTAGTVTRVWFTPAIQIQSGPSTYCNLPGMVLAVDINDGERQLLAQSISFDSPDKELLKRPKEGKKVTKEEFELIVAEKMKEMGVEGGSAGGSQIMIRIKH